MQLEVVAESYDAWTGKDAKASALVLIELCIDIFVSICTDIYY